MKQDLVENAPEKATDKVTDKAPSRLGRRVERVDKLMEEASRPARTAETVLEEQVSSGEPLPKTVAPLAPLPAAPQPTPAERGRQLLGALKPFLPVVGNALKLVDHGAAQAAARLLPLLGSVGVSDSRAQAEATGQVISALQLLEKRQAALEQQMADQTSSLVHHEEQIRRVRDTMARMSTGENLIENAVTKLTDRLRMLTAAVVILFLLVIAEGVLLVMRH